MTSRTQRRKKKKKKWRREERERERSESSRKNQTEERNRERRGTRSITDSVPPPLSLSSGNYDAPIWMDDAAGAPRRLATEIGNKNDVA
jgi:hypothetical protein